MFVTEHFSKNVDEQKVSNIVLLFLCLVIKKKCVYVRYRAQQMLSIAKLSQYCIDYLGLQILTILAGSYLFFFVETIRYLLWYLFHAYVHFHAPKDYIKSLWRYMFLEIIVLYLQTMKWILNLFFLCNSLEYIMHLYSIYTYIGYTFIKLVTNRNAK